MSNNSLDSNKKYLLLKSLRLVILSIQVKPHPSSYSMKPPPCSFNMNAERGDFEALMYCSDTLNHRFVQLLVGFRESSVT